MSRPYLVTVIGKSARDPRDPVPPAALDAAEEVGRLLARAGAVVVSGGLSGVMEAVSRGAKSAGGIVVGILPGYDKADANPYVDIAITTGMGFMRDVLNVRAADAVVMIGGGVGTLHELTVAYEDKPTVILEGTGGWADRIREVAYDGKHLEEARRATLHYASSPREAVELALRLAAAGGTTRGADRT
ncbi:MAG TPA: TIGR00725 family protein [Candidatus Limnocylindria bacterium]|nr:TIGR00725 family protein [Candidatus Limnocylindria bacterium]